MTISKELQGQMGQQTVPAATDAAVPNNLAGEAMHLLEAHKGKLAVGVAATLGLMVYYRWREKRLAKTDPEEYARLQRLKAVVHHSDAHLLPNGAGKADVLSVDKKKPPA